MAEAVTVKRHINANVTGQNKGIIASFRITGFDASVDVVIPGLKEDDIVHVNVEKDDTGATKINTLIATKTIAADPKDSKVTITCSNDTTNDDGIVVGSVVRQ
jgi:hypothetical protein